MFKKLIEITRNAFQYFRSITSYFLLAVCMSILLRTPLARDIFVGLRENGQSSRIVWTGIDAVLFSASLFYFSRELLRLRAEQITWISVGNPRKVGPVTALLISILPFSSFFLSIYEVGPKASLVASALTILLFFVGWKLYHLVRERFDKLPIPKSFLQSCSVIFTVVGLGLGIYGFGTTPYEWGNSFGPIATVMAISAFWVAAWGWSTILQNVIGVRFAMTYFWAILIVQIFNLSPSRSVDAKSNREKRIVVHSLEHAIEKFAEFHSVELAARRQTKTPMPVIVVSSQGGGIRAATHTLAYLKAIGNDQFFRDKLFAVSGVSGGSVGAGFFVAGVAADIESSEANTPNFDFSETWHHRVLTKDYLSGMLGRGMLLEPWLDRGRVLDDSFQKGWIDAGLPPKFIRASLGSLYENQLATKSKVSAWLPLLYMNATSSESGLSVGFGPAVLASAESTNSRLSNEMLAAQNTKHILSLPLTSLMSASARFPIVTPPATILHTNFLDGGYSDNLGVVTADRIATELLSYKEKHRSFYIRVIRLCLVSSGERSSYALSQNSDKPKASSLLSPLYGAMAVYGSQQSLKPKTTTDITHSESTRNDANYPLTWTISESKIKAMETELGLTKRDFIQVITKDFCPEFYSPLKHIL